MRRLVLLVDTTVLYSAIAYKGPESRIMFSGNFVFVTTEFTIAEVYRILKDKGLFIEAEALARLRSIPLLVAKRESFEEKLGEAEKLIGRRDKSDIPLVALALKIEGQHDGIWSTNGDFDIIRSRIKIWRTRELEKG